MSALAEEKGGKSAKTPTLITPACLMSSSASACAGDIAASSPAPVTSSAAMVVRILL